jgi:hypothetical protein
VEKGKGGPKTNDGKGSSSQNAIKHGGRSKILRILAGEDPEEYERIKNGWRAEYGPQGHMQETLVGNLIESEWMLQRARRNRFNAEARAAGDEGREPYLWTAEESHQVELMQRYLTTAERSFYRAFNAMQGLRKDMMRDSSEVGRLELQNDHLSAENSQLRASQQDKPAAQGRSTKASSAKSKKPDKIEILDQWVEIEVIDGKTITTLYPSNEELLDEKARMAVPPTLVYRRLNFVDGVPPEYLWTTTDPVTVEFGGLATQRMRLDRWLELIETERASGTGHLQGCEIMPRPEERGDCECESCTRAKERIETEGK